MTAIVVAVVPVDFTGMNHSHYDNHCDVCHLYSQPLVSIKIRSISWFVFSACKHIWKIIYQKDNRDLDKIYRHLGEFCKW